MEETVYINKCSIKEKMFDNGSSVLNMAIHLDEFEMHQNADGWVNISICKRKEPSDKGHTHYAKLNSYTPKIESNQPESNQPEDSPKIDNDDLPF